MSFCDLRVLARKLASPFGHPTQVSTQVQLASTCDYFPVRLAIALRPKKLKKTIKLESIYRAITGQLLAHKTAALTVLGFDVIFSETIRSNKIKTLLWNFQRIAFFKVSMKRKFFPHNMKI